MRRGRLVRWAAVGVGLLLCPLLSGCLAAGAAWPNVGITPPVQANAAADQVHAFRVDVVDTDAAIPPYVMPRDYRQQWLVPLPPHEPSVCTLAEVPVAAGGWVTPQGQATCDYSWYWQRFGEPAEWKVKRHTVMVRLYRQGCQTIEVRAWALPKAVVWRGVADLEGQEKAVEDLVDSGPSPFLSDDGTVGTGVQLHCEWASRRLANGSESPEHRKALLFAAAEYERLAKAAPDDPPSRTIADRMREKAAWLRTLAEK